ncbi:putative RBBP8 N-terminal-like protein [Naja naja]|nr:putative RBBP8 N-terminal-like protein [Naja naja]
MHPFDKFGEILVCHNLSQAEHWQNGETVLKPSNLISFSPPWTHPCLQTKLNELTNEKCRDNQRIEELFTKNHQLREQQKGLKENVKVLENRLRAGLCDRCQVTQELAKKKQHEFMKAHFQSLQHIFILTNELNKLREENKSLKEDLKRLWTGRKRSKGSPEKETSSQACLCLSSPAEAGNRALGKTRAQKPKTNESPEHRLSPESRISPNILLQGDHALDMEQLYLFNQSLALHHLGLRTNSASKEGDFPHHLLLPKDVGSRLKPHEEWEDRATILELPGAVLYMKDHHLENRIQLLNSSEKLRCLLMEQEGKGRSEDSSDQSWSQIPSLSPSIGKEGKKEKPCPEESVDDTLEQLFQINRENPDQGEKATSVQDNATEAPLDLSDYGRGRESGTNWHHQSSVKHERRSPGGDENEDTVVQKICLSSWLGTTQKHHYGNQQLESFTAGTRENIAVSPNLLCLRHLHTIPLLTQKSIYNGDSDSIRNDSDGTIVSESEMVDPCEDKPFPGGSKEDYCYVSEKIQNLQKKRKRGHDQMVDPCEDKPFPGGSVKEDYCYVSEKIQNLQKKRKRGHDSSVKAYKKPVQGGESDAATHLLPGPKDTKEMANHSPAFKHEEHKET